jgi:hypothetical protein
MDFAAGKSRGGLTPTRQNITLRVMKTALLASLASLLIIPAASGNPTLVVQVKYVSFTNPSGKPVISRTQALSVLDKANQKYFEKCGIELDLAEYSLQDPVAAGFPYSPTNDDFQAIVAANAAADRIVITATGRLTGPGSGSLLASPAGTTTMGTAPPWAPPDPPALTDR